MGVPWILADLVLGDESDPRAYLVRVVDEIVEPFETDDEWADLGDLLVFLVAAGQGAAQAHFARAAAVSNFQVSLEEGLRKRNLRSLQGHEVQKQLELAEVARRLAEWVGRKVHRREVATTN